MIKKAILKWLGIDSTIKCLEHEIEQPIVEHEEAKDCLVDYVLQTAKIQFVNEGGFMPKKATDGAAAYDLRVPEDCTIKPGRNVIPLNFRIKMPYGVQAMIEPRSGFSAKGFEVYSAYTTPDFSVTVFSEDGRFDCDEISGKIDSDYTGIVGAIVNNHTDYYLEVKKGTRIAQMTFTRVLSAEWAIVPEIEKTERGDGGFGSTGTK